MKIAEVWPERRTTAAIDAAVATRRELQKLHASGLNGDLRPGQTVAIAVGSRGIASLKQIVTETVAFCRELQLRPFIIPAMGSHGGATAEGQIKVLNSLGIQHADLNIDFRADMEVEQIGAFSNREAIYMAKTALQADHLLLINRVKPHTRFDGQIQSGLLKMLLIGLGKQIGAAHYHRLTHDCSLDQLITEAFPIIQQRLSLWGGIAIVENSAEQVCELQAIPTANLLTHEPKLLQRADAEMARLPFREIDLLIVDEIGKEISGTGMDTNVIGRKFSDHHSGQNDRCQTHFIYVRGVTEKTAGNANGIGMAEFTNSKAVAAVDWQKTAVNAITAGHPTAAMTPVVLPDDRTVVEAVQNICGVNLRLVHICNTLQLEKIYASQAALKAENLSEERLQVMAFNPLKYDEMGWFVHEF